MIENILKCPGHPSETTLIGMSINRLSGLNSWAIINKKGETNGGATNENNGGASNGSHSTSGGQQT
jgi:hypothetical protein